MIYLDECGFDQRITCTHGWSARGKRLYGERTGKRQARENLIAARFGSQLLAPLLIQGSVTAHCFEQWLSQWLLPELPEHSILILDNAPIHRKGKVRELSAEAGHDAWFLPPYSPDFNKIEHDFAALKKRRQYQPQGTSIDQLIREYMDRDTVSDSYSE